ncbi:hypothetical protein WDW37_18300 [Bdellovibrionota bacterium FG-1]
MFPQFDPSKMDPKVLMELSRLIQTLPSDMVTRMQSIMHNSMAGFDVRKETEEFDKALPPGFREKLMALMAGQTAAFTGFAPQVSPEITKVELDLRQARLTVLRGVAEGKISPEEAEPLLFTPPAS